MEIEPLLAFWFIALHFIGAYLWYRINVLEDALRNHIQYEYEESEDERHDDDD